MCYFNYMKEYKNHLLWYFMRWDEFLFISKETVKAFFFLLQQKIEVGKKNNIQFFKITQKSRKLMGVELVSHV